MKSFWFWVPRLVVASVAQGRTILRGAWSIFWEARLFALMIFIAALALGLLIWMHDRQLLETVHWYSRGNSALARRIADFLGTWGDYETYNVPAALLIWIYGAATRRRDWRRAAMIFFLGATLAGLFDDCLRLTLGRPRPDAYVTDGFYGLWHALSQRYESFPSGHAAADFGAALALLTVKRPLGVLATLFALAVAWGRMEIDRHYPSDVAVGSVIGIYFGLLVGFGAAHRAGPVVQAAPAGSPLAKG